MKITHVVRWFESSSMSMTGARRELAYEGAAQAKAAYDAIKDVQRSYRDRLNDRAAFIELQDAAATVSIEVDRVYALTLVDFEAEVQRGRHYADIDTNERRALRERHPDLDVIEGRGGGGGPAG